VTGLERLGGEGHQGAIGSQQPEGARSDVEQPEDALDDLPAQLCRLETIGERARQPGQLLGRALPLLGLPVERGVAERERGLRREPLERGQVPWFEGAAPRIRSSRDDDAQELPAADEGLGHGRAHPGGQGHRVRVRPRGVVLDDEPAPRLGAGSGDSLTEGHPSGEVGRAGPDPAQPLSSGLHEKDRRVPAHELTGARPDHRQEAIGAQLGQKLALELDEGLLLPEPVDLQRAEPGHLQRDRRVIGEGLGQLDLSGGEAADLVATHDQRAEHVTVGPKRHAKSGPVSLRLDTGTSRRRQVDGRIAEDVRGPDRAAARDCAHGNAVATVLG
jgi:hypothetical protein